MTKKMNQSSVKGGSSKDKSVKKKQRRKLCIRDGCIKFAQGNTNFCIRHGGGKRCNEPGCSSSAQGKTDFCKRHGGGKRCKEPGCPNSARGKTNFCQRHGGGKRCKKSGCSKSAEGKTDYCITHGGGYRCKEPECPNGAQGTTGFCIRHGGGKLCREQECNKSAQGKTDYCITHGGGNRCKELGCPNSTRGKGDYCITHGGGKRCKQTGCPNGAEGGTGFCVTHGGGKRCKEPGCPNSARGKTDFCARHGGGTRCAECSLFSVKRNGMFCYTCRIGTGRMKQLEMMVKNYLDSHPESLGLYSYYDSTLPCSPNRRRPDFVWVFENMIIIVEVDEHAHRFYERNCEISRVTELMEQAQGKPVFLIRFNPKKNLLETMHAKFNEYRAHRVTSETPMLTVAFIGYKEEYDVAKEIERVAQERKRQSYEVFAETKTGCRSVLKTN